MIRYLGCDAAREMLQPFVDRELPMAEQVELEAHLRWCETCAARVEDLRLIGAALRVGAAVPPVHPEDAGAHGRHPVGSADADSRRAGSVAVRPLPRSLRRHALLLAGARRHRGARRRASLP